MQKNFKLHSALHGSLSQCPECGKKFSRFASLKAHILLHIEDDTLICQHCDNEFETLRALQYHVEEEHGPNKNMNLNSVNGLDNLSNCASNSGPPVTKQYSCKVCQKDFDSDKSLKEHAQYHKKVIRKTFSSSLTNISSFFFLQINSILANLSSKKKPASSRTLSRTRYKCSHCTMEFDKPSLCSRHERVHTGERPFKVSTIKIFYVIHQYKFFYLFVYPWSVINVVEVSVRRIHWLVIKKLFTVKKNRMSAHCALMLPVKRVPSNFLHQLAKVS